MVIQLAVVLNYDTYVLGNNIILQINTSITIILGISTYKHKWKMIKHKWKMMKHKWKMIKRKWKIIKHKWKMIKKD